MLFLWGGLLSDGSGGRCRESATQNLGEKWTTARSIEYAEKPGHLLFHKSLVRPASNDVLLCSTRVPSETVAFSTWFALLVSSDRLVGVGGAGGGTIEPGTGIDRGRYFKCYRKLVSAFFL